MATTSDNPLNTNQLPISLDVNPEEKGYQDILQLYLRRIANAANTKTSGLFFFKKLLIFSNGIKSEILNRIGMATD
jgi:hypothetical protein